MGAQDREKWLCNQFPGLRLPGAQLPPPPVKRQGALRLAPWVLLTFIFLTGTQFLCHQGGIRQTPSGNPEEEGGGPTEACLPSHPSEAGPGGESLARLCGS